MKCPKCGGNAELSNWGSYVDPDYADFHVECEKCGYHSMGSTDPQKAKEMFEKGMGMYYTNEQWFCGLSTEEKATFLAIQIRLGVEFYRTNDERYQNHDWWVEWLKQPHKED